MNTTINRAHFASYHSRCSRFVAHWSASDFAGYAEPLVEDRWTGDFFRAVIPHDEAVVEFRPANKRNRGCTSFFLPFREIATSEYNTYSLLADFERFATGGVA